MYADLPAPPALNNSWVLLTHTPPPNAFICPFSPSPFARTLREPHLRGPAQVRVVVHGPDDSNANGLLSICP